MTTKTQVHSDHPQFYAVRQAILDTHPRASKAREYKLQYTAALVEGREVRINRSYSNLILHLSAVLKLLRQHGIRTKICITPTHVIVRNALD